MNYMKSGFPFKWIYYYLIPKDNYQSTKDMKEGAKESLYL